METESHNRIHSRPRFLSSIITWRFLAVIVMRFWLIAEFGLIAKFFVRFWFWFRRSLSTFAFSSFIIVIVLWCFSNQFSSFPSLLFICLSYIVVFVIVFCRFCQTNSLHCWQCICLFCSVVNQYSSFPSLPSPLALLSLSLSFSYRCKSSYCCESVCVFTTFTLPPGTLIVTSVATSWYSCAPAPFLFYIWRFIGSLFWCL